MNYVTTYRRTFLLFICITLRSNRADDKNETKCPGPLAFYDALACETVENAVVNGCANQYDCSKVKSLPLVKCRVNGKEYEIGEKLKDEDANPCNRGCTCTKISSNVSAFSCAKVDCFPPAKSGCYLQSSPLDCCPGKEICPESPEDRGTCTVDGNTYLDGENFSVESDPDLTCVCQPGYEGENVEPFCAKPKHPHCDPLFTNPAAIKINCAPVYYDSQSPQTSCAKQYRCQNYMDRVIESNSTIDRQKADVACYFGSLPMSYGDELNGDTDFNSLCVKCICEVGPTPTCRLLPDCDYAAKAILLLNRLQHWKSSTVKKLQSIFH